MIALLCFMLYYKSMIRGRHVAAPLAVAVLAAGCGSTTMEGGGSSRSGCIPERTTLTMSPGDRYHFAVDDMSVRGVMDIQDPLDDETRVVYKKDGKFVFSGGHGDDTSLLADGQTVELGEFSLVVETGVAFDYTLVEEGSSVGVEVVGVDIDGSTAASFTIIRACD